MKESYWEEKGIYYRTNEFKPDRITLVFVHGVSGSCAAWLNYEPIFENKYNILFYDIRGHGKSKKYLNYSDYEIKYFVDDLHDLVTYLNISKFVLVSNSFAAWVALEYLKLYRETVIANIFTSPMVYTNDGPSTKYIRFALKIITGILGILPFDPKPRGHVDYSKYLNSKDHDIGRNIADMRNTTLRVHFYVLRQSMNPGQEYLLQKINTPTLIMHGELDSWVPIKNAIRMSKEIKNSEFISIPGIQHDTARNSVKEISEGIEYFIEKNKNSLI
jgi:pimeloyl-ACP methyl ester carboxylesterase